MSRRYPPQADQALLEPKRGFLGMMGERGVGGSKCGSTAAVALLYTAPKGGRWVEVEVEVEVTWVSGLGGGGGGLEPRHRRP